MRTTPVTATIHAPGARGGTVRASIQRNKSQWEGVTLEGSQTTITGSDDAVLVSSNTPTASPKPTGVAGNRGGSRRAPRTASGTPKASSTAGVTKTGRGRGRGKRS